MERRERPAAPPQKLIVLLAFDKGEDGELMPAFEPREMRDEADAVRTAPLENYHARMQLVLVYIDAHLDDDLDLETLSHIAAFKYHFHRQFASTFEVTVHCYVQLARMKRRPARLFGRTKA